MLSKKYIDIQNEVIKDYKIKINSNSKCYGRTHAHIKTKTICKWKQQNSIQSTFTLFHEIGHIKTYKSSMRRCESEYYATVWAIEKFKEYDLIVPESILDKYQKYIYMELDRGLRRRGKNYPSREDLKL